MGCKVCAREDQSRIEAIALRDGPRAAGRAAECSHNAVMRHMARHAKAVAVAVVETEPTKPERDEPAASPPTPLESLPKPDPAPPPPKHPRPNAASRPLKDRYPHVAALKTPQDRKRYLAKLFAKGRFEGLRTSELLSQIWDDLSLFEFSELVSQAAIEADFRRGSSQARRVTLIGVVERAVRRVVEKGDDKAIVGLVKLWAQLDGVLLAETDASVALASSQAWRVAAPVLQQRYPEALAEVYTALAAEEQKKRAALAPPMASPSAVE
jgi:hypothetical protein